jgi:hypothetical protein
MELNMGGMWAPQKLKFFLVCSPKLLSISTGASLDVADYIAIASRCPLLQSLNSMTGGMNDAALVALGSGCPLLRSLVLEYNEHVTDAGLAAFARNGALTTLWVARCEYLPDEGFCAVAQCSPLLEQVYYELHCDRCNSDRRRPALPQPAPARSRRNRCDSRRIGSYRTGLPVAGGNRSLGLHTSGTRRGSRGSQLSPSACVAIPDSCRAGCGGTALAVCCPLLEEVGVGGEEIGDEEITALARGCPALWRLVIPRTSVTTTGLRAIRYYCGNLKEIELSSAMISDEGFVSDFFRAGVTG